MSYCNLLPILIIEELNLEPRILVFTSNAIDVTAYKKFTASVQWFACQTRPNIIQIVLKLSQHNIKLIEKYQKMMVYLLRYFKSTKSRGIRYANKNLVLFDYLDSSQIDDLFNKKLTANYLFIFNGEPISWANCKHLIVFISTYKIRYITYTKTAGKAIQIQSLLEKLGVLKTIEKDGYLKIISFPTRIFINNQRAIKLISNLEYH